MKSYIETSGTCCIFFLEIFSFCCLSSSYLLLLNWFCDQLDLVIDKVGSDDNSQLLAVTVSCPPFKKKSKNYNSHRKVCYVLSLSYSQPPIAIEDSDVVIKAAAYLI
uniref:Uncharacterized protein n=1 Tax=Glossina brevipalpis TaxID=37001 RepID=A0A1A9WNY1_9MUSC